MKAIETNYKGYRFRSRLEARWAVFFDSLGIKWRYETQGLLIYDLGPYLPDFWIPIESVEQDDGIWVEVKPVALTEKERRLVIGLVLTTGRRAYAFCGDPWPGEHTIDVFLPDNFLKTGPQISGPLAVLRNTIGVQGNNYSPMFWAPENGHQILSHSFRNARSARFEFGETPRI